MISVSFATSNESLTTLYLWPLDGTLTAPTWLLILSSFIIGGLLSIVLLGIQWLAIRTRLWHLQGKLDKLQAQLNIQHNIEPADIDLQGQQNEQERSKPAWTDRALN